MKSTINTSTSTLTRRQVIKLSGATGLAMALPFNLGCAREAQKSNMLNFDSDWKFFAGNPDAAHRRAFDDKGWRTLSLPHDWSIEDRPGAPKQSENWTPPRAQWNPNQRSKDASILAPHIPISVAQLPEASENGPPLKVGPFDAEASAGGWTTGWTVGGVGWYRKNFELTDLAEGEQIEIIFDGAYMESDVWLNGTHLKKNINGYLGFSCDLTPHLRKGEANVLAVRVANEGETARWYSGSGIYRHVWLRHSGKLRFAEGGLAIVTQNASKDKANISLDMELEGLGSNTSLKAEYHLTLIDPDGKKLQSTKGDLPNPQLNGSLRLEFEIDSPALWSPETPDLHYFDIALLVDGQESDRITQRFGIRTLQLSAKSGFQINGKTYKLHGACVHHDNGLLGAKAIDHAEYRKVKVLKKNGFNAIRCAHNPYSPEFLDACDELGMIVIDEAFDTWNTSKFLEGGYHLFFRDHWQEDLARLVRRDRNHPSVAFWSLGNEIPEVSQADGVEIARAMRETVIKLDNTRFITNALTAENSGKIGEDARSMLDAVGYNYSHQAISKDSADYPDQVFMSAESFATDAHTIWQKINANPAYIGDFVWTAIDYLGEVGCGSSKLAVPEQSVAKNDQAIFGLDVFGLNFFVWDFPAYQCGCGDIDILGRKKPASYYRDVVWGRSKLELFIQRPTPEGTVEVLTGWSWHDELASWTWPGKEGEPLIVRTYSSADEVALMLNGEEIERKAVSTGSGLRTEFSVTYQPGELTAIAYGKGSEVARKRLSTTGPAAQLKLRAEQQSLDASTNNLVYVFAEVQDAYGQIIADASLPVNFQVSGKANLLAAGSANPYGIESFQDSKTHTFHGVAGAIIQPSGSKGTVTVSVDSPSLSSDQLKIQLA